MKIFFCPAATKPVRDGLCVSIARAVRKMFSKKQPDLPSFTGFYEPYIPEGWPYGDRKGRQ